ncbi:hypothetical protein LX15_000258 [Streptoalloteichus tenebrarius]|uniref:Uncharacterized protein n=1 Tax=Streptoalloteichus tenebrarius (strain ATCC 17920 / DSM 40477 / JCM 4838 / CBS 697.72 / NBRC 16177 / NCIMB 11028 / NRRL B-12390 / A12253. 1 / ISP 5477) TaxID=1933 RepID=A0ABT1HM47_STRSD|nr:hypothetical protein [Streptoalloteichus tenebrarius]MCP2256575.1 hypothetical protein [Streptoalloteichus tenebrarius]BFF04927.1 hypothetical protein GCM10020241_66020 [Streptoalloteichus tenebrarius]
MPASARRQLIVTRCRYTQETHVEAARGVGRDRSHGLDHCLPQQRRLRALLALFLLTTGHPHDPTASAVAHRHVWWSLVPLDLVSAHHEQLVLRTSAPGVLVTTLCLWNRTGVLGLPGLRVVSSDWPDRFFLYHHPSKAVIRVEPRLPREERPFPVRQDEEQRARLRRFHALAHDSPPLEPVEEELLHRLPPMSQDAEHLLAALLVRLTCAHPQGLWRVDKLGFSPAATRNGHGFLWGHLDHWRLHWPIGPLRGLATALTHPSIGLEGARLVSDGSRLAVHYGTASLDLTP